MQHLAISLPLGLRSFSEILEENLKIRWVKTVKIIIFPSFSHIKMIMIWGKRPSSPNMSGKRPGVRTTDGLTMVDFCHAESTGNSDTRAKKYHPNCSDNHATALQNQTQEGKLLANLRNSFWLAFCYNFSTVEASRKHGIGH